MPAYLLAQLDHEASGEPGPCDTQRDALSLVHDWLRHGATEPWGGSLELASPGVVASPPPAADISRGAQSDVSLHRSSLRHRHDPRAVAALLAQFGASLGLGALRPVCTHGVWDAWLAQLCAQHAARPEHGEVASDGE